MFAKRKMLKCYKNKKKNQFFSLKGLDLKLYKINYIVYFIYKKLNINIINL